MHKGKFVGEYSYDTNINLIGKTSITFGWDTDLGESMTQTKGFTIGVNIGFLVAVIVWVNKLFTRGDPTLVPSLITE